MTVLATRHQHRCCLLQLYSVLVHCEGSICFFFPSSSGGLYGVTSFSGVIEMMPMPPLHFNPTPLTTIDRHGSSS